MLYSVTRVAACLAIVVSAVALAGAASAQTTTLTFENLTDGTSVTNQYAAQGVTFTNATILTSGLSLNELEFPPHSGTNVITDDGGPISMLFSTPITSFDVYATYLEPLTVDAYGPGGLLDTVTSQFSDNDALFGDTGSSPNELLGFSGVPGVTQVTMTGDPNGGSFVADDVTFTPAASPAVPEPAPILLVMAGGMLLLAASARRRAPTIR